MKVHVLGAAGEVTGSCYLLEAAGSRVLVDFGLFQGSKLSDAKNRGKPQFEASRVDAVVLTHAHIDHVGRMPLLPRLGYRGKVWATPATVALAPVMLRDSARLQEEDTARENRVRERRGDGPVEPLYTIEDVERLVPMLAPLSYEESRQVAPGVTLRFVDAGHILGSASVELTVEEGGRKKVVLFSADVGVRGHPLMNDPVTFSGADLVFLESTYGDRDHRPLAATVEEFEGIIKDAIWARARVLIPAFAVGRTQTLMYHLAEIGKGGRVPSFPVYIDSPLAIEATELYRKFRRELDPGVMSILKYGETPGSIPTFSFTPKREDSQRLNTLEGCAVIIAASGMCTGGRIVHHLKHSLWKVNTRVVIAGYQGEGTLGRRLVDGAKVVRVAGEWVTVRATVHTLGGFSAHAGQSELVEWTRAWAGSKPRVCLTHGEDRGRIPLKARLEKELGLSVGLPGMGEVVEV